MKPKQVLNFLGGMCLAIGVLLALGGSSAWALFVVAGGLLIVIAQRSSKKW
ncbi:MAG: hypothetical protein KatS3mg074_152 [Meiothermus sp.]|uniref:Uncharacterized protein n=2 Tax=Meiothermus hypogaeus TaxID=884155 RepID=A0A511R109_9DEIN|nr:hypothetical protein [Meiothermus hypogaeus]RIH80759.1 hypothetical protein Mhypo_00269 [Meiothermus hypogaeus]GEM83285.1 hypothetical protein MHY01S_14510 [Meiothermus hypogaeus NBRC 106114]GIW37754.1 MAG: hypothetical protein KatS3mg074_152 [Meiothermus sp.]